MCLLICRFLMIFRYFKCATHEDDFVRAQVRSAQFLRIVWNLHNCFFTVCNIDSSTSEAPAPVQKKKKIFGSGEIVKNDEGADETRKA